MRPVRARTCVCCETVPQEQLGDPTRFLNGREVMEENLQAAMQVTKKATWTTGTIRGRKRKDFNKKELGKIKPSKLMKKEEDIVDSSIDSDNNSDVLDL